MTVGNAHNWRATCYGRQELQKTLQGAWSLTVAGMPQFLVLKGMTGIGKTRLVQELYRWLSLKVDLPSKGFASGYWPDLIINEATKERVNPIFDQRARPEIPFLWLGLKFDEPAPLPKNATPEVIQQLATADSGKALRDALPHLMPHAVNAIVKRDIRTIHGDWFWKGFGVFMTGIGMIPVVGSLANIPGWFKDLWELWKGNQQKLAAAAKAQEPVLISQQKSEQEAIDQFLNTLRLFLDSTQQDLSTAKSPQIPVVLFLDDAHWGDPLTLRMVKQLWKEAHEKKWPLFVVATHWDDEWDLHRQLPERPGTPLKMAHFQERIDPGGRVGGIREIPVCGLPVEHLREWVNATLPGLPDDQQNLLLHKADAAAVDKDGNSVEGGSPRVLEHLMQLLLEDPEDAFVGGNIQGPIKDGFVQWIETELSDLNDIIKRRFAKLPREVRHALGWSSEQGRRFLCEINQAIAKQIIDGPDEDQALVAIRQAETPHHWIDAIPQRFQGESRYNLCEFRSNVFREVAKRNYSRNVDTVAAVRDALSSVLSGWLFAGRMDTPETIARITTQELTVPERRDALRICVNHFRPKGPVGTSDAQWKVYGNALARLVSLDLSGYRWGEPIFWDQALASAMEFATAHQGGWGDSLVEIRWQIEVIDVLWRMHHYAEAEVLLKSLHTEFHRLRQSPSDKAARRSYALVCERLAIIHGFRKRLSGALSLYLESLEISREIVTEFGRSPESLRDVFVSHGKLSILYADAGEKETACEQLAKCGDILEEIQQRGWADAQTITDRQWFDAFKESLGCPGSP